MNVFMYFATDFTRSVQVLVQIVHFSHDSVLFVKIWYFQYNASYRLDDVHHNLNIEIWEANESIDKLDQNHYFHFKSAT